MQNNYLNTIDNSYFNNCVKIKSYNIELVLLQYDKKYVLDFNIYTNRDSNTELVYEFDYLKEDEINDLMKLFDKFYMFTIEDKNYQVQFGIYADNNVKIYISLVDMKLDSSISFKPTKYSIDIEKEDVNFNKIDLIFKLIKLNIKRSENKDYECKLNNTKYKRKSRV